MTNPPPVVAEAVVKSGRRKSDIAIIEARGRSIFFWIFGMFLDDRHKPSMSRIMLALWTMLGAKMIYHELDLHLGQVPLSNAVWQAWWAAEGVLALAVFGPSVASYFGVGAAGAAGATALGAAIRDDLGKVNEALSNLKEKYGHDAPNGTK
jgi:hypothetical protein